MLTGGIKGFSQWTRHHLTNVLDFFALLTLVAELEAAGWVATDLSAGHPAVTVRFGDDHVLIYVTICVNDTDVRYERFMWK